MTKEKKEKKEICDCVTSINFFHHRFVRLLNRVTGQFFLVILYCDEFAVFRLFYFVIILLNCYNFTAYIILFRVNEKKKFCTIFCAFSHLERFYSYHAYKFFKFLPLYCYRKKNLHSVYFVEFSYLDQFYQV